MFNDLREFIEQVEKLGESRVVEGADWDLEIGRITELALSDPKSPLLVFDKIKGYPAGYRVVTNFLNSPKRISMAMGLPLYDSDIDIVHDCGLAKLLDQAFGGECTHGSVSRRDRLGTD